jgi:hypothetical protein
MLIARTISICPIMALFDTRKSIRSHKSVAGFIEGGRIGVIAVSEREEHADDERPGMDAHQVSELRSNPQSRCEAVDKSAMRRQVNRTCKRNAYVGLPVDVSFQRETSIA